MKFLENMDRAKITLTGLAMAVVLFLAVNVFSNATFRSLRLDLTEDGLYTISEGTRKVLASIDETITVRIYFSKILGERSPVHATYHARVRELLEQYRDISGGKLHLELLNPEPFSDAEDRAVAFGLKGVPVNSVGDLGYFGLAATNSTDGQEVIGFFNREREQFIEYDLTKLIHTLASPEKKVVGLLSSLPIDGGRDKQGRLHSRPWMVFKQIEEFFEVRKINPEGGVIPAGVDILMIVHPKDLSGKMQYAIDQFVLGGGKALVFVDPNVETEMLTSSQSAAGAGPSDLDALLKAWGVAIADNAIAADLETARRVNAGRGEQVVVADYVAWLKLSSANFDENDVITSDIKSLNMATAGVLEKVDGATTEMTPIVTTSTQSMKIKADDVRFTPDVLSLFRNFRVSGEPLTLAARIKGTVKSAFPDGPPPPEKDAKEDATEDHTAAEKHLSESVQPINIVVVADADMLHDRFWLSASNFMGQQVYISFANNADFVVNTLDNLSGSNALIGLRGRGRTDRPFDLVEGIRLEAEKKFRAKEKQLTGKLKGVEAKLEQLQSKGGEEGGEAILTADDKKSLDRFRMEMLSIRKELRNVQHELRKDIDSLDGWLKFFNIAAMPLLLGGLLLAMMAFGRVQRHHEAGK